MKKLKTKKEMKIEILTVNFYQTYFYTDGLSIINNNCYKNSA
jgi:hypothetical protein